MDLHVKLPQRFATRTAGMPLTSTATLGASATGNVTITIPPGNIVLLKTLKNIRAAGTTLNSIIIDGVDQRYSAADQEVQGGTAIPVVDFERLFGAPYVCRSSIVANFTAPAAGDTPRLIARGIMVEASL